jgi:N-acetylneuraminate synthase
MIKSLDVAAIKIASPELNHLPLLKEVAGYGLPVFLSTGVSTLIDIEKALSVIPRNVILLHCITAYPAPEEEYNLRVLATLGESFGVPVGISDHSLDPVLVPALGAACGACALEKHFTLNRREAGLDDPIALDPAAFASMAAGIRRAERLDYAETLLWLGRDYGENRVERVLGDGIKDLALSERENYATTNRSIHARGDLAVGELLTSEKLCIVRSEKNLNAGLWPEHLPRILGRRLRRSVAAGQGITWEDLDEAGDPQ